MRTRLIRLALVAIIAAGSIGAYVGVNALTNSSRVVTKAERHITALDELEDELEHIIRVAELRESAPLWDYILTRFQDAAALRDEMFTIYRDIRQSVRFSEELHPEVEFTFAKGKVIELEGPWQPVLKAHSASRMDLNVNYSVSGTATSGVDYVPLSGTITIPAGFTGLNRISITPIDDTIPEEIETVIVTLEPGIGYTLGEQRTFTILIHDPVDHGTFGRN